MTDDRTRILIEEAGRGDAQALEELLVRYIPRLRAFVRLRCGPEIRAHESTSDVAQSVCREMLAKLPEFEWRGEAAFRSWLFTEALHKIVDRVAHYRAAKRDVRRNVAADAVDAAASDAAVWDCYQQSFSPSQHAIAKEQAERIESAIGSLSDEQREVVVLARIVGLSRGEIAARLGKTEGAVRTMLHRALAIVSDCVESA